MGLAIVIIKAPRSAREGTPGEGLATFRIEYLPLYTFLSVTAHIHSSVSFF